MTAAFGFGMTEAFGFGMTAAFGFGMTEVFGFGRTEVFGFGMTEMFGFGVTEGQNNKRRSHADYFYLFGLSGFVFIWLVFFGLVQASF